MDTEVGCTKQHDNCKQNNHDSHKDRDEDDQEVERWFDLNHSDDSRLVSQADSNSDWSLCR